MCPNDGEWGGLGWSINLDCLPNDYSAANNTAAAASAALRASTNGHKRDSWRLFPLHATAWFLAVTLLREADMFEGGWDVCVGGGAISSAFYLSFKSLIILQQACMDGDIAPE